MAFDPSTHRVVQDQLFFEDFYIGQEFPMQSRTMTEGVFAAFQAASGDTHPVHYDREYCRRRGMPDMLAHGFQTLIHTAGGAGLFASVVEDSLVAFLEQSSRFLKPVYVGDTIYPGMSVVQLTPGRTTGAAEFRSTVHNQKGELALEGVQKFLVKRRRPEEAGESDR